MRFTPDRIDLNPTYVQQMQDAHPLAIYQPTVTGSVYIGMGIEGQFEARLSATETADLAALVERIVERVGREASLAVP